jgi:hypothetical protein
MEKRNIELTIETAERWFNGCDRELKQLALQTFPELEKNKLPKSWEELDDTSGWFVTPNSTIDISHLLNPISANKNVFAKREQAEACIALAQLSQLMKVYNNGWVADWNNVNQNKYSIALIKESAVSKQNLTIMKENRIKFFLSFKDYETAELFIENFHKLIEIAKPLL